MTKTTHSIIILLIALQAILEPINSNAQNEDNILSTTSLAEKIYLQLDGKVYTKGNIVWFKCIVLNSGDHIPSALSGVLYVELITPEETIHEKKLIKIENGIGQGFFYLGKDLSEGLYLVRAYTQWNKNFGSDFFFEEYIRVFDSETNGSEEKPITDITLVKEETNKSRLKAGFNPLLIDKEHKDILTVIVSLDDKKDTLTLRKEKSDLYRIDYEIEAESRFATLQMQTENNERYSTTIVLNEDVLDLQFFPESGELVHRLQSKVGFKALDANGQGKFIEGDIVDEKDSVITSFKSNELGMGSFILNDVDSTKKYFARLVSKSEENQVLLYPLPRVASRGNTLSVERKDEQILLTAMSNYLENDSISLIVSFRGVRLYDMKVGLKQGIFKLSIPVEKLPEGIIAFTMKDSYLQPVAERLYFNERQKTRLNISVSTDKDIYGKRELTDLSISTTDSEGNPLNTNLSVLVINKQQLGKMQSTRQNILSWFLLNSELRGKIENPGFYFKNKDSRPNDLDALMLTQGWRKYNYSKQYNELPFQPELSLSVSGQVSSVLSKKIKKQAELTMLTFGEIKSGYTQTADSLGRFRFDLVDEYGDKLNVLIQSAKKSGKKMDYNILLDKNESPPVEFNHTKTVGKLDSVVKVLIEKNEEREKIDEAFPLQSGDILLDEVEVIAYRLTPTRKKVMEEYGEPEEVIEGEEILAQEEKWSYGLYSVLMFKFPDVVDISRGRDGTLYAVVRGTDMTLVVIDGKPIKYYDYKFIPNIPPSEVSSFEIIRCAENFLQLYIDVTGSPFLPGILCGSVISIYTHSGKGIYGVTPTVGLMQATVPVFSASREFYAPKYENIQPDDWTKPDLRALVHWEPELETDSLGNVSLSFYNADNVGEMVVVMEAVSDDGRIGYKEFVYEVEGKEKEIILVN